MYYRTHGKRRTQPYKKHVFELAEEFGYCQPNSFYNEKLKERHGVTLSPQQFQDILGSLKQRMLTHYEGYDKMMDMFMRQIGDNSDMARHLLRQWEKKRELGVETTPSVNVPVSDR